MTGFQEQIKIEIEDNKRYIYSVEEEIRHEVGKFEDSITNVGKQSTAFHTEYLLEMKQQSNAHNKTELVIKSLQEKLQ